MHRSIGQGLVCIGVLAFAVEGWTSPKRPRTPAEDRSTDGLPVELAWDAPAGCPSANDVRAHLADIATTEVSPETHLVAHGTITRKGPNEFQLVVEATAGSAKGVRTITASTCASLANAAAIVLEAMLADEEEAHRPPALPEPTEASGERNVASPSSSSTSSLHSPRAPSASPTLPTERSGAKHDGTVAVSESRPGPAWNVGLSGTFDVGTLPGATAGGAVSFALATPSLSLGLLAETWLPRDFAFETPSRATAHFTRFDGAAYGCAHVPLPVTAAVRAVGFRLGPCAEVGVTRIGVAGVAIPGARSGSMVVPVFAGGVRADASLTERLRAVLRLDATFPMGATPIGLRTGEGPLELHRLSVPAFRASFGFELTLH